MPWVSREQEDEYERATAVRDRALALLSDLEVIYPQIIEHVPGMIVSFAGSRWFGDPLQRYRVKDIHRAAQAAAGKSDLDLLAEFRGHELLSASKRDTSTNKEARHG